MSVQCGHRLINLRQGKERQHVKSKTAGPGNRELLHSCSINLIGTVFKLEGRKQDL